MTDDYYAIPQLLTVIKLWQQNLYNFTVDNYGLYVKIWRGFLSC